MIKKIDKYIVNEIEFSTLNEAIQYKEEQVGKFIDRMFQNGYQAYPVKMKIEIFDFILANREELIKLLSFSSDKDQFQDED